MGPVEIGQPPVTIVTAGRVCPLCHAFQELAPAQDGANPDVVMMLADTPRHGRVIAAVD